ncbi:hypothetical protein [Treponema zioleckii]|uniref:hypothetical protein n=1 Tax=Treponema zioleckii TaxID=331680 RepID=UPI00168A43AA|nr:hypothetical protein [Treponema zioleckii]
MMKKAFFTLATLILTLVLFLSCGGEEYSRLDPENVVSMEFAGNWSIFIDVQSDAQNSWKSEGMGTVDKDGLFSIRMITDGEESSDEILFNEFVRKLISLTSDVEKIASAASEQEITVSGNPYLEINKKRTNIKMDFTAEKPSENQKFAVKINLQKTEK